MTSLQILSKRWPQIKLLSAPDNAALSRCGQGCLFWRAICVVGVFVFSTLVSSIKSQSLLEKVMNSFLDNDCVYSYTDFACTFC